MKELFPEGLYYPRFEHDSCSVGFIANIKGRKLHQLVSDALTMPERMEHRGACRCEPNTGDGTGILIQGPHEFYISECRKLGFKLPPSGTYGVGLVFFPRDTNGREACRTVLNQQIKKMNMSLLGYRVLPTDNSGLSEIAAHHGLLDQLGIQYDERGNIKSNRYKTSIDHVFAAGGCRKGQSLVVWVISEGREAARTADEYLMGHSELGAKEKGRMNLFA